MDDTLRPAYAHTLLSLRTLLGVQQQDLAAALGILPKELSRIERGHQPLERRQLAAQLAVLGFPPAVIDLTLDWRQKVLQARAGELDLGEAEEERAAAQAGEAAAQSFRRALAETGAKPEGRREERQAAALWARFERLSPRQQHGLVHGSQEYQGWAFCVRLCEESERAASSEARPSLELAYLAIAVAQRVDGDEIWRNRLQGYAWLFMGNARRVQGDLPGADAAFDTSRVFWEAGIDEGSRLDTSRRFDLLASLRIKQDRFAEAAQLLEQASSAQPRRPVAVLLKKANLQQDSGDYTGAVTTLYDARGQLDLHKEPQSWLILHFNLGVNLWHLGRYNEASALLPETRALAVQLGAGLRLVRILWLEGRLAAGLGQKEKAVAALEQVRRDFLARKIAFDAALVSLELASLYLEDGWTGEVKQLATELVWIFSQQGVAEETKNAVNIFCRAVEKETASLELIQVLAQRLLSSRKL